MVSDEFKPLKTGQTWAACDSDIRRFVHEICGQIAGCLAKDLKGIVLHGSLATGAFHRPKSDIDLLVVSEGQITDRHRSELWTGLLGISDNRPLLGDIELSILRSDVAARPCHPMPYELHFGENLKDAIRAGTIEHSASARDEDLAAHVKVARERGVSLEGPAPGAVLGEVAWQDYLAAIGADFDWIVEGENIIESPFYGVLNICRVLRVLTEGEGCVPDKEEGALWGMRNLASEHHAVIERALDVYRSGAELLDPTAAARRQGAAQWPPQDLLAFRDFAKSRYRVLCS